jgi:simple sugar transport system permease protein
MNADGKKTRSSAIARLAGQFRRHPTLWPFAAMVLLILWNVFFTPGFARYEVVDGRVQFSLLDILQRGTPVMLMAVGMTLVIALAGIDLSVGSVMALAGTIAGLAMMHWGQPAWVAVPAALGVALAAGAFNGAMVTFVGLQPIIATLVLLVAGRGIAQGLTNDQKIQFKFKMPDFEFLGTGTFLGLPIQVYIVAVVVIVVALALRKTALGLYIEAIGGNVKAARMAGLPVHAVRMLVYMFCGVAAGLAGLVYTANIGEADVAKCGLYLELDAILAVVIGGTSLAGGRPYLAGSVCGAVIMQTLTTMLLMHNVIFEHALIVKAVVALAVCLIQAPVFWAAAGRVLRRREAVT